MEKTHMTDELLPIKRIRKKPKEGDVFVIQPEPSVYYYGKVIKTNIESKYELMRGMNLIFLFNKKNNKIEMPKSLEVNDLLLPPTIVNFRGWSMGYFFTVGNMNVTEDELNLDYGFWHSTTERFVNEKGEPLSKEPSIFDDYALGSYGSIAYMVQQALGKEL